MLYEVITIEQFGATSLEHLGWEQLMDSYACIMCNRCQEVCPAYNTGKVLSPAALEINKRYYLNHEEGMAFANGEESKPLTECVITSYSIHYTKLYEDMRRSSMPLNMTMSPALATGTRRRSSP